MSPDTLDRNIEETRRTLKELAECARGSADQRALTLETLEALSAAVEELHVAGEELRQQNEELTATRQIAEAERQRYQDLFAFAPDAYLIEQLGLDNHPIWACLGFTLRSFQEPARSPWLTRNARRCDRLLGGSIQAKPISQRRASQYGSGF